VQGDEKPTLPRQKIQNPVTPLPCSGLEEEEEEAHHHTGLYRHHRSRTPPTKGTNRTKSATTVERGEGKRRKDKTTNVPFSLLLSCVVNELSSNNDQQRGTLGLLLEYCTVKATHRSHVHGIARSSPHVLDHPRLATLRDLGEQSSALPSSLVVQEPAHFKTSMAHLTIRACKYL